MKQILDDLERASGARWCPDPASREGPEVPRPARAATPREDTAGSNATEEHGSTDATRLSSVREIRRCPACSHTAGCNSFERPRDIRSAVVSTPTFRTGLIHVGTAGSIRTRRVLPTLREIGDVPLAVRTRRVLTTLPDYVRQAARILRVLATSRESTALSNDSESRAARRRSRLEPCERAEGPRAEAESAEDFLDSSIRI